MHILDTRTEKNLLGTFISDLILALLSYVAETEYQTIHQRQAEGIAAAKARGVKFGRRPTPLPPNFIEVSKMWKLGKITLDEAASESGMSRSTFHYKAKRYGEVNKLNELINLRRYTILDTYLRYTNKNDN